MLDERFLIVNADDFGLTDGVNDGIIEAHQRGVVTSTSLMVRAPAAATAAAAARANPGLGLGLHVDIGEWVLRNGSWHARYELVAEGDADRAAAEVAQQVALFKVLTGKLPDHIDSHQHVHLSRPEVAVAVDRMADQLGVGVRSRTSAVAYRGMYGQDGEGRSLPEAISSAAYVEAIELLPPGATEFGCHPGYAAGLDSDYRLEREKELRTLCDPAVRSAVVRSGVTLITWADLVRVARP